jgi:hypothetical protein
MIGCDKGEDAIGAGGGRSRSWSISVRELMLLFRQHACAAQMPRR